MKTRINILFLFTDDQRFDTIHALGNEQINTPNLDYLVNNGTSFLNAYIMGGSSGAVCMPSRAMMLTGRTLYQIEGEGQTIPSSHPMLPEVFKEAGYTTFGTGKWHNGTASYARSFNSGAEIFFGGMDDHWNVPACHFDPTNKYPAPRPEPFPWLPDQPKIIEKRYDHMQRGKHSSELFVEATCDFLCTHDHEAQPFFAYVSFMAPHDPRTMPQQFLTMYDANEIDLPQNFLPRHPFDNGALNTRDEQLEEWPRRPSAIQMHLAEYYAMITHLDHEIGRILDALKATGQFDNTIIILAGDNGLALGQHGLMGKQNIYDHSVHVPLIMMGPGIQAGGRIENLCYLLDIFPTLCDLAGLSIPDTVEGKSLGSAFTNARSQSRESLYFAFMHLQRGVRDMRYKLIETVAAEEWHTQLFDLRTDPFETNNLAHDPAYEEHLARLRKELNLWRERLGDHRQQGQQFWDGYSAYQAS